MKNKKTNKESIAKKRAHFNRPQNSRPLFSHLFLSLFAAPSPLLPSFPGAYRPIPPSGPWNRVRGKRAPRGGRRPSWRGWRRQRNRRRQRRRRRRRPRMPPPRPPFSAPYRKLCAFHERTRRSLLLRERAVAETGRGVSFSLERKRNGPIVCLFFFFLKLNRAFSIEREKMTHDDDDAANNNKMHIRFRR